MELKIPLAVVSPADVTRLIRELNSLDDFFAGAAARKSGSASPTPPRLTRLLDSLAKENQINLLDAAGRKDLEAKLQNLLKVAPALHISFAVDPPPKALERILIWLRENIDPNVLVKVGLQPTIAAGCILRTPNKLFDMSLRARLKNQEPYLAKLIAGAIK
ncbi:MAG: hypothetical protein WD877_01705 [Candidatus Saccharimonadales bacterium]